MNGNGRTICGPGWRGRGLPTFGIAALTVLLSACGGSTSRTGAAVSPTFALTGAGNPMQRVTCGVNARHDSFRIGTTVAFDGVAAPDSGASSVQIFVRRCVDGQFVTVKRIEVQQQRGGRFHGVFAVHTPSACYAQAVYKLRPSVRRYFIIR